LKGYRASWIEYDVQPESRMTPVLRYPWGVQTAAVCLLLAALVQAGAAPRTEEKGLTWGTAAVTLKPAWTGLPTAQELLTDSAHSILLNRFYRIGGESRPVTPTECRISYNAESLFVVFRCLETNQSFPAIQRNTNWLSLQASPIEKDALFPDKVELFIQPDLGSRCYYQFVATMGGLAFGCKQPGKSDGLAAPDAEAKSGAEAGARALRDFDARVIQSTNEWTVLFRIGWNAIGGRPPACFGLLPMRTRWRDGEITSPAALDFSDRPALDLFVETHFSGTAPGKPPCASLCRLPSGALRWQRPALLTYPDAETLGQIWRLQQSLYTPTDRDNLAPRLYLTQRWVDLLLLEGFSFSATSGSIAQEDLSVSAPRCAINFALRNNRTDEACRLLDAYLQKLGAVSARWFADGSPGDILEQDWKRIDHLETMEEKDGILVMHCLAGARRVDLHLSLPATGGVRLCGNEEGYFKPPALLPLNARLSSGLCSIPAAGGKVVVSRPARCLTFYDGAEKPVTRIDLENIAFRFDPEGRILAVDFKNRLDRSESIYGFGERYDRFNQHGHILTLWGVDAWGGNTAGLKNQSYKPIAFFHSSKGYSVFDNSTWRLRADIGATRPDLYRLTQQGPILDQYFWIGPPEQALESYTSLTGKPILPPKWAFEPWMGRTGRGWNNSPGRNPVAEQERVVERFAGLDIPHSAIYSEGNSAESPALNAYMARSAIKVLSWYYPVISPSAQAALAPDIPSDELPILQAGDPQSTRELGYVDFTNPNALEVCRRWWNRRLTLGVAGSMVDFGDRVPEQAVFYDGRSGAEMHNFYSYDYQRTYSQVFHERRDQDYILFGRAAAPGTQRWVAQFSGDHPSNFGGLQAVLTGALSLCACGFSTWGSDMGGFLGWPEPEVYIRWTQFACFSPLMRSHGRTPREPWNYGEAAIANYKRYAWLRENLLDYVYDAAIQASQTGVPIMRSMAVAYPRDPSLAALGDQYMFGRDLLVAPILSEGGSRCIRLPSGKWTSLWDGKTELGPATIRTCAALDIIPVYLRQGALVPVELNQELQLGGSMSVGRVKALLVTAPSRPERLVLTNEKHENAEVLLRPEAGGFVVRLNNLPEMQYLLVYGQSAAALRGDGQLLAEPARGRADAAIHRVVIRLAPARPSQGRFLSEVEVLMNGERINNEQEPVTQNL
jgi:alpha-glucosidase (family GH31 glycosyl hydrolase)